jgi:uncharacterized protein YciI
MKSLICAAAVCFLFVSVLSAQEKEKTEYEMKNYFMVFLKKGPDRSQDSLTVQQLQKGHLENIQRLADEGKLVVAGPFLDDGELRGIFVFDVAENQEVVELLQTDPAIKAGRLSYEIHPWMTAKGTCFP